jgi:hypothetical protein
MDQKLTDNSVSGVRSTSGFNLNNSVVSSIGMIVALSMFIYIGGSVGSQMVRQLIGTSQGTDQAMVTALLLNIALIMMIWRRTSILGQEINVYRQAEVRAQHMAMTDPLTNLFNRRAIKEKTAELSARASRRGKSIAFNFCAKWLIVCGIPSRQAALSHGLVVMNSASA